MKMSSYFKRPKISASSTRANTNCPIRLQKRQKKSVEGGIDQHQSVTTTKLTTDLSTIDDPFQNINEDTRSANFKLRVFEK